LGGRCQAGRRELPSVDGEEDLVDVADYTAGVKAGDMPFGLSIFLVA